MCVCAVRACVRAPVRACMCVCVPACLRVRACKHRRRLDLFTLLGVTELLLICVYPCVETVRHRTTDMTESEEKKEDEKRTN